MTTYIKIETDNNDDSILELVECLSFVIGYDDLTFSLELASKIKDTLEKHSSKKLFLIEEYKNLYSINSNTK